MATRRRRPRRKSPPSPRKRDTETSARSALEAKARSAIGHFLDVLEQDPERVVRGAERFVDGLEKISDYIRENPEDAKKTARNTALSAMAKLAKKKLGG